MNSLDYVTVSKVKASTYDCNIDLESVGASHVAPLFYFLVLLRLNVFDLIITLDCLPLVSLFVAVICVRKIEGFNGDTWGCEQLVRFYASYVCWCPYFVKLYLIRPSTAGCEKRFCAMAIWMLASCRRLGSWRSGVKKAYRSPVWIASSISFITAH